ncbi:hypothetical protein [Tenacibaculum agarivorans]|uniref:hypothetical protein n=1 Tax=Tenacibaculum agarivorans TaxID=1908389 RepID=UPI00117F5322|nr:hypothetical protein [Tenacibaculum agarivorans]
MSHISNILENPYVKLFISIGLIVIGIEEVYKADVPNIEIHWKHGISFYAILLLIQAVYKIIKGAINAYKCKCELNDGE